MMTMKTLKTQMEVIADASRRLNALLSDPQPGLSSWVGLVGTTLDEIAAHAPSFERRISVAVTTEDTRVGETFLSALCGTPKGGHPREKVVKMARLICELRAVCGG